MGVWGKFHLECYNKLKNNVITASVVNVLARIVARQFTTTIQSASGQSTQATFYVTEGQYKCILGFQSSTQLGLITLNVNSMAAETETPTVEKILQQHQQLFQGTVNLKGVEITLQIDDIVTPVAQARRRIPHKLKKKVNAKLAEMRENGIIEKVDGVTPGLSPQIAIQKKTGDVRVVRSCVYLIPCSFGVESKYPQLTKFYIKWKVLRFSKKRICLKDTTS